MPDGPRLALQEVEKLPPNLKEDWAYVLLLLGKKEEALVIYRKAVFKPAPAYGEWNEFYEAQVQFLRGELSEEEYLARAGVSRARQTSARCDIGLFRLATGDRRGAREHFRQGARWAGGTTVLWCQMFLSRMEKDDKWPPWIPVKK